MNWRDFRQHGSVYKMGTQKRLGFTDLECAQVAFERVSDEYSVISDQLCQDALYVREACSNRIELGSGDPGPSANSNRHHKSVSGRSTRYNKIDGPYLVR
jgi:hypothetical protein